MKERKIFLPPQRKGLYKLFSLHKLGLIHFGNIFNLKDKMGKINKLFVKILKLYVVIEGCSTFGRIILAYSGKMNDKFTSKRNVS